MTLEQYEKAKARQRQRYREDSAYRQECKDRANKWSKENPERRAENQRKYGPSWWAKHPEKRQEYNANIDKEQDRKRCAAYRAKNPEKRKQITAAYRESNREKLRADGLEYARTHPEVFVRAAAKRRARKLENGGELSKSIIALLMAEQGGKCSYCFTGLSNNYHVDHVIPISRGGPNKDWNVQLLCPTCNRIKRNRDPLEFLTSLFVVP